MQLQFVKSALTVNPCMVSKPVRGCCGGYLQTIHPLEDRGLPPRKFAPRFAHPSKWTACSQADVQAWELTLHFIRLCPPMPFRLFNTMFVRLLKSQMSKNVRRPIA